jgi:hypothetical protein
MNWIGVGRRAIFGEGDMMRFRSLAFILAGLILLLFGLSPGLSQETSVCTSLVQNKFVELVRNCADAGGNTACFGSSASASFSGSEATGFSQPGDILDLSEVSSITTLPLDTNADQWGLALLNVHANIPLSASQQGLKYFLLGDVQIENAVDPDTALQPGEPLIVTVIVAANLRSAPSTEAKILSSVPAGTELSVDGLSNGSGWLRVFHNGGMAWVSRQVVTPKEGDLDQLPELGRDAQTLMQSFFLKTGAKPSECAEVPPPMLVIQGPEGINASIVVNGTTIRFDSAIGLRVSSDNRLHIYVFDGSATIDNMSVPAGFTMNIPLSDDGYRPQGGPTGLHPINEDERSQLNLITNSLPPEVLYNPLDLPTREQMAAMIAQMNSAAVGQTVAGPASSGVECSRFQPTSPLGSLANGITPFYWDGAPGATTYRLSIYGEDGELRGTYDVAASTTTLTIDTAGGIGTGSNFSWNVEALVDGQVACTTGVVSLPRDAFPQFVSGGGDGGDGGSVVPTPTPCVWIC